MVSDEIVDRFTKVLASIYSNLMLREIEALRNGVYKDLTFHEIHTIEMIGNLANGTVGQIAKSVGVTQSTMSTMIDKLVKKGLAKRTRSDKDRRVLHIHLTKKGEAAYQDHEDVHRQVTRNWLEALSEDEQRITFEIMKSIDEAYKR